MGGPVNGPPIPFPEDLIDGCFVLLPRESLITIDALAFVIAIS
jgi:hypothetical protein